ncbi:hypothetical protein [Ethanoligenens harbinense]|nr:hypothetical protein [Ethanoligenens harbinense]
MKQLFKDVQQEHEEMKPLLNETREILHALHKNQRERGSSFHPVQTF